VPTAYTNLNAVSLVRKGTSRVRVHPHGSRRQPKTWLDKKRLDHSHTALLRRSRLGEGQVEMETTYCNLITISMELAELNSDNTD